MKRTGLFAALVAAVGFFGADLALAQVAAPAAPSTAPAGQVDRGGRIGRGGPGGPGGGQGRGAARGAIPTGPSAPVPPQVAIPRPSADELAQINGALKKLVETDNSSAAPVLKKYESLIKVEPPRLNVAATYTQTGVRAPRHDAFVEIAKKGDIDLLLHGDSITDWWTQGDASKAVFDKYFGSMKTANFAVAGDTTQGLLWGLKNGEGEGFSPKAIMLMIGTNNMGSNTAEEVAEGVGAVVMELRKDFPTAKILLLAIFPRSVPGDQIRDKIAQTNKIISKLDDQKNVFYMDIGQKFLDPQGNFLPDTFRNDNLHPVAGGYEIWGAAVKDKLAELMK
jgi:lysophospholipase L1-like esterase